MCPFQPENFFQDLAYINQIEAPRQRYYIYQKEDGYLIVSISQKRPNSYNATFVENEAVDFIGRKFSGRKGVTSSMLVKQAIAPAYFGGMSKGLARLKLLSICYILVALGKARMRKDRGVRGIQFDFK